MQGLIAAAGLSTRLQDLSDNRNKVLIDLGGDTLLGSILSAFEQANISPTHVVVGFDAPAVRMFCRDTPVSRKRLTRPKCMKMKTMNHQGDVQVNKKIRAMMK